MAATTTPAVVRARFLAEVSDAAQAYATDVLCLAWLQDAVALYSDHRPLHTEGTLTVLADTVRYAAPTGAVRIKAVRDESDGESVATPVPYESEQIDGLKILLAGDLPPAGRVLTVYHTKAHTRPATITEATTPITVDDADIRFVVKLMKADWMEGRAGVKGEAGRWKAGIREEDESKGAESLIESAKALREEVLAELRKPTSLYTSDRPMEQGLTPRADLRGASRFQGSLGWSGGHPGTRRRGV